MQKRSILASLALLMLSCACLRRPARHPIDSTKTYSGAKVEIANSDVNPSDPNPFEPGDEKVQAIISLTLDIEIANAKFKGNESKLNATVEIGANKIEGLVLEPLTETAKISISKGVPLSKGLLAVQIFEGNKLLFSAKKHDTTIDANRPNAVKIEDCSVSKVPWTGDQHESSCGWEIQD